VDWLPGDDPHNPQNAGGDFATGNVDLFPYPLLDSTAESSQYTQGSGVSTHWSIVFNTFVMMQLFNEFNSRKLQTVQGLRASWQEWNVFLGITRNPIFLSIVAGTFVCQVILMQVGGLVFAVNALSLSQWFVCVALGAISLPWQFVINACILLAHREPAPKRTFAPASPKLAGGQSRDNSHSSNNSGLVNFLREGSDRRIKVNVDVGEP
jgi:hypothetical protein